MRYIHWVFPPLLLVAAYFASSGQGSGPASEPPSAPHPTQQVHGRLARQVSHFPGIEANRTLGEALHLLARRFDVKFSVDQAAFRAEQVPDVLTSALHQGIPQLDNHSLQAVLRKVMDEVPSQSGATFRIRENVVEITTSDALARRGLRGEMTSGVVTF